MLVATGSSPCWDGQVWEYGEGGQRGWECEGSGGSAVAGTSRFGF